MSENFSQILGKFHKNVKKTLGKRPSEEDAEKYKKFLDDLVYSKNENFLQIQSAIKTALQKDYEQYITDSISMDSLQFKIDATISKDVTWDALAHHFSLDLNRKESQTYSLKSRFSYKNAQEILEKIQNDTTELLLSTEQATTFQNYIIKSYNDLERDLQEIKKFAPHFTIWDYISEMVQNEKTRFITPKNFGGINNFRKLGLLLDAIETILSPEQLPYKISGDALELLLAGIGTNFINKSIDTATSTAIINSIQDMSVKNLAGGKSESWEKDLVKNKSFTISSGKNFSIKMNIDDDFNPFTSRQGKADVIIETQLPDTTSKKNIQYKISAKNWSDYGSFGETEFIYAIIRSLGTYNNKYLAQLLECFYNQANGEIVEDLNNAHNLAKYAIAADILMGYSQKNMGHEANMIVINLNGKGFIVFPLKTIFEQIYEKGVNIHNYPYGIKTTGQGKNKQDIKIDKFSEIKEKTEIENFTKALRFASDKVSLKYYAIKDYIPEKLKLKT